MPAKAPKGGLVSRVNGQFYEGGEFIPDHGLFCGKKGAVRRKKVDAATARGRYYDLGGSSLFEILKQDGGSWLNLGIALADSNLAVQAHGRATFGPGVYVARAI
jgi:hypothetical protein